MRHPADEPTAWLVRAEGGHSEGRGPWGSLPTCAGGTALAGAPRPGVGRLSWPAAEWGLGGASSTKGSSRAARVPCRGRCRDAGGSLGVRSAREPLWGPRSGGEEASPGKEGGLLLGSVPHSLCLPLAPPRVSVPRDRGQRVGAPSPAARHQQGTHVFPVCTCVCTDVCFGQGKVVSSFSEPCYEPSQA